MDIQLPCAPVLSQTAAAADCRFELWQTWRLSLVMRVGDQACWYVSACGAGVNKIPYSHLSMDPHLSLRRWMWDSSLGYR